MAVLLCPVLREVVPSVPHGECLDLTLLWGGMGDVRMEGGNSTEWVNGQPLVVMGREGGRERRKEGGEGGGGGEKERGRGRNRERGGREGGALGYKMALEQE